MVEHLPIQRLRTMKSIADTLHSQAAEIFHDKKAALQGGDEGLVQKVGEGKDIMSILCELIYIPQ